MTAHTSDLPRFKRPPVVEVALSIQLEPLSRFRSAHYGMLWEVWRSRYPAIEDQPPLAPLIPETDAPPGAPRVEFQLDSGGPLLPRCWYVSGDQTRLVQAQPDRFGYNWRRLNEGDEYPHFDTLRPEFEREFAAYQGFVDEYELGELRPVAAEVTYVNAIVAGEVWSHHAEVDRVLASAAPAPSSPPAMLEDLRVQARYVIRDEGGALLGRILVDAQPVFTRGARSRRSSCSCPLEVAQYTSCARPGTSSTSGTRRW